MVPAAVSVVTPGVLESVMVGVGPVLVEQTMFDEHATLVTGRVTSAAFGTVPDVSPAPLPVNEAAETVPENVGAPATANEYGKDPVMTMFEPAVGDGVACGCGST